MGRRTRETRLLEAELAEGPARGSAALRRVLEEVADGVRSAAEADLRSLIKRGRLPDPMYNPRLYAGDNFIAELDAWWADAGWPGRWIPASGIYRPGTGSARWPGTRG